MRIRKNAKISQLIYAAAPGTVIQTYVCQLNQSPWDTMSFSSASTLPPPPSSQVYGNGVYAEINGSSFDSISVSHSASDKADQPVNEVEKSDDMPIFCCKTNGRNWHCRKKAVNRSSFCEYHLSQVKNYNSLTLSINKQQSVVIPEGPKRRGRPRKQVPVLSSTPPDEYYYYMGFCPSWKKKRGESTSRDTDIEMVDRVSERDMGPTKVSKFVDDYIDSTDDEDEEAEDDEEQRKRARKPVKARSLKSLM